MRRKDFTVLSLVFVSTACRVAAPGEERERDRLHEEGQAYSRPFEERDLPFVDASSPYPDLLPRALAADPEIEAAYFEWAAAFARSIQAGTPPNPTIGLGYIFQSPMQPVLDSLLALVSVPLDNRGRLAAAAEEALARAKAAHARFEAVYYARRGSFRTAYARFDAAAREVELTARDRDVARDLEAVLRGNLASGKGNTNDLLRARIETARAEDALAATRAELRAAGARVNALLSRETFAPLDPPGPLEPLALDVDDARLLTLTELRNPGLVGLTKEVEARRRGTDRARAEDSFDLTPSYFRMGAENQFMLSATIPLHRDRAKAIVEEAEAELRKAMADRRVALNGLRAETAASITRFREAERKLAYYRGVLVPASSDALAVALARYGSGSGSFADAAEARRAKIEIDRAFERARTQREEAVADLLACCGLEAAEPNAQEVASR